MMKRIVWIGLLGLLMGCSHRTLPPELFNTVWVHSQEEDIDDVRVYHPDSFNFPPSRGRDGFKIIADGHFILRAIGRADGNESIDGLWSENETDVLSIVFKAQPDRAFKLRIISSSRQELKVSFIE